MPFDPTYPTDGNAFVAEPMRQQLLSLKAMIDALVTPTAAQVDAVNTLSASEAATVAVAVSGNTLHFTFGIPRGRDGNDGAPGSNGSDGQPGLQGNDGSQGITGEISQVQLSSAISGTSNNTNSVGLLGAPFADADMESLRVKINEMLLAARR